MRKEIKNLNLIILSMKSKQKFLNDLENQFFKMDIYNQYIESLININLDLLGLDRNLKDKYINLMENYIDGKIDEPEHILKQLVK